MTSVPRRGARDWPLAVKVIAALALTLLPLLVGAVALAVRNYQAVVTAQHRAAAAWALPVGDTSIGIVDALGVALPVLMWLGALLIGWLVAARFIVKPLTRMRRAVEAYGAGDKAIRLDALSFTSREVGALAGAFDGMADAIAHHDAAMGAALAEQRRLTREVHHRVKNNLQIVSSLLSIQAREATSPDVARAYALVQARVAALAVVHRWMYDSETPGGGQDVDLRALATDLCAGLEQSLAATEHIAVAIRCDVERLFVGQDTAVPLAFLITELISCAARLSAPAALTAEVSAARDDAHATLRIAAPCFARDDMMSPDHRDPTSRIIQGMARQLRAPLVHDAAEGSYTIRFALPVN